MRFSRYYQKSLALTALLAFSLLIQSAPFPVPAQSGPAPADGPVALASADQPGATEIPAAKTSRVKKKRFPWGEIVFPLVLVGVAAAVLIPVLTNKYDIAGSWDVSTTWPEPDSSFGLLSYGFTITFSPYNTFFTAVFDEGGISPGSYRVDGKDVSFRLNGWIANCWTEYTGQFIDKNHMSGTMKEQLGLTGTWTAARIEDII